MIPEQQSNRPQNTRRYPRYDFDSEIKATVSTFRGQEVTKGRSLNLNEGGVGGAFVTGWDVGAEVNLQFSVPTSVSPLLVKGVIRNRISHSYGFEFVDLNEHQQLTVARACRTLALMQ